MVPWYRMASHLGYIPTLHTVICGGDGERNGNSSGMDGQTNGFFMLYKRNVKMMQRL